MEVGCPVGMETQWQGAQGNVTGMKVGIGKKVEELLAQKTVESDLYS